MIRGGQIRSDGAACIGVSSFTQNRRGRGRGKGKLLLMTTLISKIVDLENCVFEHIQKPAMIYLSLLFGAQSNIKGATSLTKII